MTYDIAELNEKYRIHNTLTFVSEPDTLPAIYIANDAATAKISLHGAQILSYTPRYHKDILWVSKKSYFADGKPIRGGIPICCPWFGAHPSDSKLPLHGFARLFSWNVIDTKAIDGDTTRITFELCDNSNTKQLWPYDFCFTFTAIIGKELHAALTIQNRNNEPVTITAALHSYFNISDITKIAIHGLENVTYTDSLTGEKSKENSPIIINKEIDRVYHDFSGDCMIDDSVLYRTIKISKEGSNSTVVWNPWIAKSERMPDFGNDEYKTMICVETTNALDDAVTIKPFESHTLATCIELKL